MKTTMLFIFVLALLSLPCRAQEEMTEERFAAFYDELVPRLKAAEKESAACVGRPFSEFVELLGRHGVKINEVWMQYNSTKLYPQEIYGLSVFFDDESDFTSEHDLWRPRVIIYFEGDKPPYEKALALTRKYDSHFEDEMAEFYSTAVTGSVHFIFASNTGRYYKKTK